LNTEGTIRPEAFRPSHEIEIWLTWRHDVVLTSRKRKQNGFLGQDFA